MHYKSEGLASNVAFSKCFKNTAVVKAMIHRLFCQFLLTFLLPFSSVPFSLLHLAVFFQLFCGHYTLSHTQSYAVHASANRTVNDRASI